MIGCFAVESASISAAAVQDSARRVLCWLARVGAWNAPGRAEEQAIDRPEHRALIRRAGAEGIVLLKNDGILPLGPDALRKLAVIGPNAKTAQIMGGGSAQLNAHYRVSPIDGLLARLGGNVELAYELGCTNYRLLPTLPDAFTIEYFNSPDLSGEPVHRAELTGSEIMWLKEVVPGVDPGCFSARLAGRFAAPDGGDFHFGLVSAGLSRLYVDGERVVDNWEHWEPGQNYFTAGSQEVVGVKALEAGRWYDLRLEFAYPTPGPLDLKAVRLGVARPVGEVAIERAVQLAAASDATLLFVGHNGEWDTEGQDRPHMDLVGRQNELIERVAAANPQTVVVLQTGGPVTMPWLDQVAAVVQAWYPGQECGNAIADVFLGDVNPAGRLPQTFPARLEKVSVHIIYGSVCPLETLAVPLYTLARHCISPPSVLK